MMKKFINGDRVILPESSCECPSCIRLVREHIVGTVIGVDPCYVSVQWDIPEITTAGYKTSELELYQDSVTVAAGAEYFWE